MENLSSFGDADFDVKSWINQSLAQTPDDLTLIQHVANLRTSIQLQATNWSNTMEELSAQCLPRVLRTLKEIESLRNESETLIDLINNFDSQISALEVDTSQSIRVLSELEIIKKRMDSCNSVIKEADHFKILLKSIDSIYNTQDIAAMSKSLSEMNKSFSVLQSLTEFEHERIHITKYTEKLESVVRPKLVEAFEKHKAQQAIECIETFKQIQRQDQISLIYQKRINSQVLGFWKSLNSNEESNTLELQANNKVSIEEKGVEKSPNPANSTIATNPPKSIDQWISKFYDILLPFIHEEAMWIPAIFQEEPQTIIAKMIIGLHTQLFVLFDDQLKSLTLNQLMEAYVKTRNYATSLDSILRAFAPGLRLQVMQSIFSPFRKYQRKYPELERNELTKLISQLGVKPNIQTKVFQSTAEAEAFYQNSIENISKSTEIMFSILNGPIERCIKFTEGAEAEGLLSILSAVLVDYISHLSNILKTLKIVAGVKDEDTNTKTSDSLNMAKQTNLVADWSESFFKGSLGLLSISNKLKDRIAVFSQYLKSNLIAQQKLLFGEADLQEIVAEKQQLKVANLFIYNQENVHQLAKLYLTISNSGPENLLLTAPISMAQSFCTSVQRLVFETMFGFIRQKLSGIHRFESWRNEDVSKASQFSISPQAHVKHVVEHFLTLSQLLEPFEYDETMNQIKIDPFGSTGQPKYPAIPSSIVSTVGPSDQDSDDGFASRWVSIVAEQTQLLLCSEILQIPSISKFGVTQLDVDISHLCSVLSVLGLDQNHLLQTVVEYLKVQEKDFVSLLGQTTDANQKKILILLGRSRKILPSTDDRPAQTSSSFD